MTVFGASGQLELALAKRLYESGVTTHLVSALIGWLRSTEDAIIRLDTPAGAAAAEELAVIRALPNRVIALHEEPRGIAVRQHCLELVSQFNGDHFLIWHPPIDSVHLTDVLVDAVVDFVMKTGRVDNTEFVLDAAGEINTAD